MLSDFRQARASFSAVSFQSPRKRLNRFVLRGVLRGLFIVSSRFACTTSTGASIHQNVMGRGLKRKRREPLRRSRRFLFRRLCRSPACSIEIQNDASIHFPALQFGENMVDIVQPVEMDSGTHTALCGEFE